jgi:hypothetical protein
MKTALFPILSFAGLLVLAFAIAPASAQTPTRPPVARPPAPAVQREAPNVTRRPHYIFEAIQMYVVDETGIDWTGSDEVVAHFKSDSTELFTGVYGDLDTGETRAFRSGQRCITPAIDPDGVVNASWGCDPRGRAGPVTFTITLYEFDGTLRHFLTNSTQFRVCGGQGDLRGGGRCAVPLESTVIGRYRVSYTEADLARANLRPGQSYSEAILIDNCSEMVTIHEGICGYSNSLPNYAAYRVTIRITRMPDELTAPLVRQ